LGQERDKPVPGGKSSATSHLLFAAVAETYIPGESAKKSAHERIADYFNPILLPISSLLSCTGLIKYGPATWAR